MGFMFFLRNKEVFGLKNGKKCVLMLLIAKNKTTGISLLIRENRGWWKRFAEDLPYYLGAGF